MGLLEQGEEQKISLLDLAYKSISNMGHLPGYWDKRKKPGLAAPLSGGRKGPEDISFQEHVNILCNDLHFWECWCLFSIKGKCIKTCELGWSRERTGIVSNKVNSILVI